MIYHVLLHFMLHPDIWYSDVWWFMIIMIYHMLLHFMLHPDIWYSDLWWCMVIIKIYNDISYATSLHATSWHSIFRFMLHPDIQYLDLWWCMIIMIYATSLHATSWHLINIIYNIKNLTVYLWFLLYLLLPSHYTKNNDIMMEFINTKYIYCYKFATYCYIFVTCSIAYPCMQVFVAVLAGSIYGIGGTNWVMCLLDTMKVFG